MAVSKFTANMKKSSDDAQDLKSNVIFTKTFLRGRLPLRQRVQISKRIETTKKGPRVDE